MTEPGFGNVPGISPSEGSPPDVRPPPHPGSVTVTSFYPPGTQRLVFAETLLT